MPHLHTEEFRSLAHQFADQSQVPGMAVAVAQDGHTLLSDGFGWRSVEHQLPVTPDTVFGVASVTKSFAAMAVMQLQDAGRLSVTDPVRRWLPEFQGPAPDWVDQMTLHHLLTHTSGLPGMPAIFHARAASIAQDPNRYRLGLLTDPTKIKSIRTYQELIALMAELDYELLGPPGSVFNYSNEGFALLQGVIERASDRPFLEYMQERILDPLQMHRSAFRTADLARLEPVTELYAAEAVGGKLEIFHAPVWWDVGEIYTNGSLKSTVNDLLRYLEVYRTGGLSGGVRLLSSEAVRQMTTPHVTLPTGRQYGYGLDVQPGYHGVTAVGHGGSIKGVSAHVLVSPEAGVTAVALCNRTGATPEQLTFAALNGCLGLPFEEPRQAYPTFAAGDLSPYAAEYRNQEGSSAEIRVEGDRLQVVSGGLPLPARPYAADSFVIEPTNSPIRFLRDENGEISGLFMGVRVLPRVKTV